MSSEHSPSPAPPAAEFAPLADAGCIVLRLDNGGRILFLNPFGLDLFGYRAEEVVGHPAVGTIFPQTDHGGAERMAANPALPSRGVWENRCKNGERKWVVWSNRALRDAAGQPAGVLALGLEIAAGNEGDLPSGTVRRPPSTDRRSDRQMPDTDDPVEREIAALRESRDRYRLFATVGSEGILFHDRGVVIEVNDAFAEMVERPREKLLGVDIMRHFVAPVDVERMKRNIAGDGDGVFEIDLRSASGRHFPTEWRTRPGRVGGRSCQAVCVREISQRKETERRLIQSQKMEAIGTLASGIAHDFNNVLAGIQGHVEVMRHRLPSDSPQQQGLELISQIVRRGANLSGQLLGYARGGQTEVTEIDLNRLVQETVAMFAQTNRQVRIDTRLQADTPCVSGDRTQIEQVLLNLLINAVQAMPEGGTLSIETGTVVIGSGEKRAYAIQPGTYAMMAVRDTGHGMDRETLKRIFEPFFTTKAKGQGTGLGLASTYGIVKNHKGYIDVTSRPQAGSCFSVLLPASTKSETIAPENTAVKRGTGAILMVDDEPDFLDLGRQMLSLLGYQAITARDGDEAVARFREKAGGIKLVIMDMIMPGPPADQTIRRLREMDPSLRVLLSSGHSQDGEVGRRLMPCGDGFIQKPFRLASLSQKIKELMGTVEDEDP